MWAGCSRSLEPSAALPSTARAPIEPGPIYGSEALSWVVFSDGVSAACDLHVIGPVDLQVVQGSDFKSGCSVRSA